MIKQLLTAIVLSAAVSVSFAAPKPAKPVTKPTAAQTAKKKLAAKTPEKKPKFDPLYVKNIQVKQRSIFDRLLFNQWKKEKLPIPLEASDHVLVRRLYLDLLGRLPTPEEAMEFVNSKHKNKYERTVDKLLSDERFAAYWTMHFSDILRIKSEFPINLWPNAVYGYQRRIYTFLRRNESYDRFLSTLLLSQGSNFRVPEVNFYRATADRTPAGIAKAVVLTVFGIRYEKLSEAEQKNLAAFFEDVKFKSTREWKEEIVYLQHLPERTLTLMNGKKVKIKANADARRAFASYALYGAGRRQMAQAAVNRAWYWFFGSALVPTGDDLRGAKSVNPGLLDALTNDFMRRGCNFRLLCRNIVLSAAYRSASLQPAKTAAMNKAFAAYPVRRMEAEMLDDAIRDITETTGSYSSVIPEPFSFLPKDMRTVDIADGSISSSFLILFGRPARDAGTLDERNDRITPKQRLFLFNSGQLFRKVQRIAAREDFKKLSPEQKIDRYYWLFYSRPPMAHEKKMLTARFHKIRRNWVAQRNFWRDLGWIMVNSAEFLHRH